MDKPGSMPFLLTLSVSAVPSVINRMGVNCFQGGGQSQRRRLKGVLSVRKRALGMGKNDFLKYVIGGG